VWPINASATAYETVCTLQRLALVFNETTKEFEGVKGVKVADFDGLAGMLHGAHLKHAYERVGYVEGDNLFGAPFDWRHVEFYFSPRVHFSFAFLFFTFPQRKREPLPKHATVFCSDWTLFFQMA
jgi:hypothetical protein